MNKIASSLAALATVAMMGTALAQTAPAPATPAPATPAAAPTAKAPAKVAIPTGVFFKGQASNQYFAKTRLLGAKVVNKDGVIIGDIEDLILSTDGNEVQGVIMGVGGFLGAGEKKVGVRYGALQITRKDGKQVVALPQATKEVLAALDPYTTAEQRKTLLERAKEKAKEFSDKAKESGALEKAKEAGKAAVDKSKELGTKAMEKGKHVIDAAKEKAGSTPPKQ